jgi:hypothetical protein
VLVVPQQNAYSIADATIFQLSVCFLSTFPRDSALLCKWMQSEWFQNNDTHQYLGLSSPSLRTYRQLHKFSFFSSCQHLDPLCTLEQKIRLNYFYTGVSVSINPVERKLFRPDVSSPATTLQDLQIAFAICCPDACAFQYCTTNMPAHGSPASASSCDGSESPETIIGIV